MLDMRTRANQQSKPPRNVGRRRAVLELNVEDFIKRHGINHVALLTLTFDHDLTFEEAQVHTNSLRTNVLRPKYGEAIVVREPTKRGRPHLHVLLSMGGDVRTGINVRGVTTGRFRTASKLLRSHREFWRKTAPKYGFGCRYHLSPVEKNAVAIAKYLSKGFKEERCGERFRIVSYVGHKPVANNSMRLATGASALYRQKTAGFVRMMFEHRRIDAATDEAMSAVYGTRWAFIYRGHIEAFSLEDAFRPAPFVEYFLEYSELRKFFAEYRRTLVLNGKAWWPHAGASEVRL